MRTIPLPVPALLAVLLVVTGTAIGAAMLRTSTTFDEIVMVAGGARGFETGDWHLVPEHPPLVQYLYGLPAYLSRPAYPDESASSPEARAHMGYRYQYAQRFFWRSGNDPERLALLGRLPAVLVALGLIALVFAWTRRIAGDGAGLLAAALTATLPDVLAHGGVAYNDVPLALTFAGAIWALDHAVRAPRLRAGLVAGVLTGLALAVKNSAVALAPIALLLLVCEAWLRRGDRDWRRAAGATALATLAAVYLTLVLVYRGDVTLEEYRYALGFAFGHVTSLPVPGFLLGEVSTGGWWYFFPVAFLFKTSAGLHVLVALALVYSATRVRRDPIVLLRSRARAPLAGLLVFGALLVGSDLNIGFRHALPALPLVCILTACGVRAFWEQASRPVRALAAGAVVWTAVHVASYYPFFLGYLSEYGPGRESAHRVLVDSSLDWGQGLLELRDFMREHEIDAVYLAYFGSALPEGYGITYVPLASFFPLPPQPPPAEAPRWLAISATNLAGAYLVNDPYAEFRGARPNHVLGNSIHLYELPD